MTSSQGVVKPISSGTLSPPSVEATTSGTPVLTAKPSTESILTRGFRRNRSVKGASGERAENGKVKMWEWKGTVCNKGINVGGCTTGVLVISVSTLLVSIVNDSELRRGVGQDFFEFSVRVRRSNGRILEYHHAQPLDMVTEVA
jgi:hypothetical protein